MSVLKKAQTISDLMEGIEINQLKLDFITVNRYQDEFYVAYSRSSIFSEYTNNCGISEGDLLLLRNFWEENINRLKNELEILMGGKL